MKQKEITRRRIFSFFIDFTICDLTVKLIFFKFKALSLSYLANLSFTTQQYHNMYMLSFFSLITSLFFMSYFTLFLYVNKGQTIGMMIMDLKAITNKDEELGLFESMGRALGYVINTHLGLMPFIINAFTKDGKGLSEFISQTHIKDLRIEEEIDSENENKQLELFNKYSI